MTAKGPSPDELHAQVQHRLVEELGRSERRLRGLLEDLPEAVFQCDEEERLTYVSGAWHRMLGHQWSEVEGTHILEHVMPEDRVLWPGFPQPGEGNREAELRLIHRSGEARWFRLTLRTPERTQRAGLAHDITDRKELEGQLLQSQKMEAVGRLAGGVAHDFNNLLTVITMGAESAAAGLEPGHECAEDIEAVLEASEQASALTRQLLSFGRKHSMSYEIRSLEGLVLEMKRMLSRLIGPHIPIKVENYADRDSIRIDPAHFQQVLLNLAVNARDAMSGGGTLTFRCTSVPDFDATRRGALPGVCLSVIDTGVGIPAEDLQRVFEPFYTTKGVGQGTGIGLALVYAIIQQSGGRIEVESEVGQGTRFHLTFPIAAAEGESEAESARATFEGGTETVLVVDDDPLIRRMACKFLRNHGYCVEEVASGEEALSRVRAAQGGIDLVITDIMMPGMNGHVLMESLREENAPPRVLMMTGYDSTGQTPQADVALLSKPFRPGALLTRVREVLDATWKGDEG